MKPTSRIVFGATIEYYVGERRVTEDEYNRLTVDPKKLRTMLATASPPCVVTDNTFLVGSNEQFANNPQIGDFYKQEAEKRGQSVKGKKYLSSLAAFPGDPEAWVDGRGDVQRVLEKRGWGSDGSVKVKAQESREAPKEIAIADDIVDNQVRNEIAKAHVEGTKIKDVKEVRHKVRQRLKPAYKK